MRALDCARAVTQVRLGKEVRLTGLGNVKSPPIFHAMCVETSTQSQLQTAELTALIY